MERSDKSPSQEPTLRSERKGCLHTMPSRKEEDRRSGGFRGRVTHCTLCKKKRRQPKLSSDFAESTGFEPVDTLRYRQFSKLLVSATHPTLRSAVTLKWCAKITLFLNNAKNIAIKFLFYLKNRQFTYPLNVKYRPARKLYTAQTAVVNIFDGVAHTPHTSTNSFIQA